MADTDQYYHHHHYYHPDYDHYHDEVSDDPESSDEDEEVLGHEVYYDDQYEQSLDDNVEQLSDEAESVDSLDWRSELSDVEEEQQQHHVEEHVRNEEEEEEDSKSHNTDQPSSSSSSSASSSAAVSEPNSDEEPDQVDTLPTDTWTAQEQTQGYLASTSRVPSRVSPVIMTDEQLEGFFDLANQHLVYQAAVREKGFARTLYDIAEYYDFVRGKWLLFVPANLADLVWEAVCAANYRGELGGYCECSPYDRKTDSFRIAVFCNNFAEIHDCVHVLKVLEIVLAPFMIHVTTFKPEFLSALGVYKQRRKDKAIDCRYTFGELNISDSWLLPELKHALLTARRRVRYTGDGTRGKRGGKRRRRRRRRKRKSGRAPKTPYWPEQPNPFQTNKAYKPSRPNSRWTAKELSDRQLVHHSDYAPYATQRTPRDLDAFLASAKRKLARWQQTTPRDREHRRRFMARMYALAESADYTIGKWKIFAPARVADALWAAVCRSNARGRLGGCVKICEYNPRSGGFLVCVYVNDFTAVDECTRVLYELERICAPFGVSVVANFKADFLTKLGIYHSRNGRTSVQYTFGELRVARDWPYAPLKSALDEVKRARRARTRR